MIYDFTTALDRSGTNALKWDTVHQDSNQAAVLPLWVADMDFAVPPAVHEALTRRVAHPVYGYTNLPAAYFEAVCAWNRERYARTLTPADLLLTPSVLHAMSMAVRAFTQPGDALLNLPPVYYPFFKMVTLHDRQGVEVPLRRQGLRWDIDFDALEASLSAARAAGSPVKALLFSNPHNPTGRVWTRAELEVLAQVLVRHDVLLLSDEIHSDLVSAGHVHTSALDLPQLADRALVFAGPNKTFNIAGLPISHVVVRDSTLRTRLKRAIEGDFYDQPNVLAMTAALAAYQHGGAWLDELRAVIAQNLVSLQAALEPWGLKAAPLEATYLAWVDFTPLLSAAGFHDDRDLAAYLEETGRVKMTAGSIFRTGGSNHLRFNLATPGSYLAEGLGRMVRALEARLR